MIPLYTYPNLNPFVLTLSTKNSVKHLIIFVSFITLPKIQPVNQRLEMGVVRVKIVIYPSTPALNTTSDKVHFAYV